jgi:hypothetical protein
VVSIKDRNKFKEAIRTKLILEVAGRTPERRDRPRTQKSHTRRALCAVRKALEYPNRGTKGI